MIHISTWYILVLYIFLELLWIAILFIHVSSPPSLLTPEDPLYTNVHVVHIHWLIFDYYSPSFSTIRENHDLSVTPCSYEGCLWFSLLSVTISN